MLEGHKGVGGNLLFDELREKFRLKWLGRLPETIEGVLPSEYDSLLQYVSIARRGGEYFHIEVNEIGRDLEHVRKKAGLGMQL